MARLHVDTVRVQDTTTLVRHLYKTDGIGTASAGALLISLGVPAVRAHSSEIYHHRANPDKEYPEWRDETGRLWKLNDGRASVSYRDEMGNSWRWSGGYMYLPDPQPVFYRAGHPNDEAAFCYVMAAAGLIWKE